MMRIRFHLILAVWAVGTCFAGPVVAQPPFVLAPATSEIAIGGVLEKQDGTFPTTPHVTIRIEFFDVESDGSSIYAVEGFVDLERGNFSFPVSLPTSVLEKGKLWYEIWLDTNGNGFEAADRFGERFAMREVPFAARTGPLAVFNTNGGNIGTVSGPSYGAGNAVTGHVGPFFSPAQGADFTYALMTSRVTLGATNMPVNYGIYDSTGTRIAWTGLFFISNAFSQQYILVKMNGHLDPNKLYYAAAGGAYYASNNPSDDDYVIFAEGLWITSYTGQNGSLADLVRSPAVALPDHFDPKTTNITSPVNLVLLNLKPEEISDDVLVLEGNKSAAAQAMKMKEPLPTQSGS